MLQSNSSMSRVSRPAVAMLAVGTLALSGCGGHEGSSLPTASATAQSYSLSATVSGLRSSGLMLAVNGAPVSVTDGATGEQLAASLPSGTSYSVTVTTQPTGEACTVTGGTGTIAAANVGSVVVTCSANTYTVGGSISGLTATGLLLLDNGADAAPINASATQFTMSSRIVYGSTYAITVQTQPPGLFCSVSDGSGTVGAADVSSVSITCAPNFTLLHSFAGGSGDGEYTQAGLIQGSDGSFYGTTYEGGPANAGTVFKITSDGAETVLYSFVGGSDGWNPFGSLIEGTDGNLYGTTFGGGVNGQGTVFKITAIGIETVLYAFAGGSDGSGPYANLIQGSDGNFYGTTTYGGDANGDGTVFKITPSGTETVLYAFAGGSDGVNPQTGLIQGSDGNLYGTTPVGGANNDGTVFEVTTSGVETVLHSFGGSDGAYVSPGLIQGSDGNFYGTTWRGGANNEGTVFEVTASGVETVLYSFAGGSDGANPAANLTQGSDGNFYGTTANSGANDSGTVFEITPGGAETVLYAFAGGSSAAYPYAGVIQGSDGNLYGTTALGGAGNYGTVFRIRLQ